MQVISCYIRSSNFRIFTPNSMDKTPSPISDRGSPSSSYETVGASDSAHELRRDRRDKQSGRWTAAIFVAAIYLGVSKLVIKVANVTYAAFGIPVWAYRFLTQMAASIPDDKLLPGKLKSKLDAAIASGDRNQIRPLMQEVRAWAETQGIELLAGGRGEPPG